MTPRLVRRNYGSGHTYTLDGRRVDGVTTAIGRAYPIQLKQWAANISASYAVDHWDELADQPLSTRLDRIRYAHKDTLSAAALRGQEIHDLGRKVSHGEPVEIPERYVAPVEAYARFLDRWGIEPIASETPLANTEYGYGGTADLWATIDRISETALVDLKTGSGVYTSVALQLAAYRRADLWQPTPGEERADVPQVDACYVAHIHPDAVELVPVEVTEVEFRQFLYVLQSARWIARHDTRDRDGKIAEPLIGPALTHPEEAAS